MLEIEITARRGDFGIEADLVVPRGVTALIGPSGSGKSSLLRLIAGLDRPESGRIVLDGNVWAEGGARRMVPARRRRIGMVFQTARLLPQFGVKRNIGLGLRGGRLDDALLEATGCDRLLDKPVSGLSGGEQQRVMLARALAGSPDLLLLDEPMSALDAEGRDTVMGLLADTLPQLDIPVIHVTHQFEEAVRLAHRFARMDAGRIVATGTALEVLGGAGVARQEAAISNVIAGRVSSVEVGGIARISIGSQTIEAPANRLRRHQNVMLRLWARDLILARQRPREISARNCLAGRIAGLTYREDGQVLVRVGVDAHQIEALVMGRTARDMDLRDNQRIFIVFKTAAVEAAAQETAPVY